MSGIELALAIAPLLLGAVKVYQKSWEYAKSATRPALVRDSQVEFCRNLHYEVSFLTLVLEQLISELPALDGVEKTRLLAHDRDLWKSPRVSTALEQRLRGEHEAFIETLEAILDAFERVIRDKSLPLNDTNASHSTPIHKKLITLRTEKELAKGGNNSILNRLTFTSNEKTRISSLKKITNCNKKMQRLLDQSIKASAELRNPRSSKSPMYGEHRELISELHMAMAQTCTCGNIKPHEARVCLVRVAPSARDKHRSEIELDMLISTECVDKPPDWQESHVRIVAEQSATSKGSVATFSVLDDRSAKPPNSSHKCHEVKSLCALIEKHGSPAISISFDFQAGKLLQSRPRRRSLNQISETEIGISLSKLLDQKTWKMSLKERRILAVTLAHTVLNFSEGPWLQELWDKTHIFFFGVACEGERLDYSRPYLSTHFGAVTPKLEEDDGLLVLHQNPSLLSLGILLLELHKCEPIEHHWQDDDLDGGHPNANTNLVAAERLLENCVDDIYENYRAAVEACLTCEFATVEDVGLKDEEFRRLVHENIVAPLEEELWTAFKVSPHDLPHGLQTV
ncbi:hypothetical protein ACLMJK_006485 [Lecanora helva]